MYIGGARMENCGIYKFTNLINGKIYIGRAVDINRRYNEHLRRDEQQIDKAIRKYGIDNFHFEIIELCRPDELNELEQYWIVHYNSVIPNGYNCNFGGGTIIGEDHPSAKITKEEIYQIREYYKNKTYLTSAEMWRNNYTQYDADYIARIFYGQVRKECHMDVYDNIELKAYYHYNLTHSGARKPGELNPAAIVSDKDALRMRILYRALDKYQIFNLFPQYTQRTIVSILMGQNWKHIPIYRKRKTKDRPKGWEFPQDWDSHKKEQFLKEVDNVNL